MYLLVLFSTIPIPICACSADSALPRAPRKATEDPGETSASARLQVRGGCDDRRAQSPSFEPVFRHQMRSS